MKRSDFVAELSRVLGLPEDSLREDTSLEDHPAWDSVGQLAAIAMIDEKLGVAVSAAALSEAATVKEVLDLVVERLD